MWNRVGIGIFFIVSTTIIMFAIIGLSGFMERLYKRKDK